MSGGSEQFGPRAMRLSALAARALGWRPDHFWTATPAELAAILAPPLPTTAFDRADLERLMEQQE